MTEADFVSLFGAIRILRLELEISWVAQRDVRTEVVLKKAFPVSMEANIIIAVIVLTDNTAIVLRIEVPVQNGHLSHVLR